MTAAISELAKMIEDASGFVVPERSFGQLAAVAREQIASLRLEGVEQYMELLSVSLDSPEWRHLLSRITVKESYLYRGRAQMAALGSTILDEFVAIRRSNRLKVWCAGCARGEEAVTLATVIAGHRVVAGWDWTVLATDVDDHALEEARLGRYGERAMAQVPDDVADSFFSRRGDRFEVAPGLLEHIHYRRLNLIEREAVLEAGPFDVIFLRNVLIYFRPDLQRRVVKTVEDALAPDGVLFLGPSESLLSLESKLRPRDLGACFCYRWPPARSEADRNRAQEDPAGATPATANRRTPAPAVPRERTAFSATNPRVRGLLEALQAAEFEQARTIALTLRHEYPENPVTHAMVGFAASRMTDFAEAVLAYRGALYLDPGAPEIRFLLAVALEADGRGNRALREYRSTLIALGSAPAPPSPIYRSIGLPDRGQLIDICRKKIHEVK